MDTLTIYSDEELKRIQKIELAALKDILRVCEILNINCFLIGGSALGAVRHNGFIPWDDDIDVGMLRADYLRFLGSAEKYLNSQYTLQSPYGQYNKDSKCPYPYTKIRINDTKFIEYCNRNVKMHHGVYVDIFPFDEVPDDEKQNLRQFNMVQRLKKIYGMRENPDVSAEPVTYRDRINQVLRLNIYYVLKIVPRKILMDLIDFYSTRYNGKGNQALACLDFPKRKCEYALKTEMFPLEKHIFEDIDVYIPGDYDSYLTHHYGDWRKLPPKEQRFGHKPWRIDLGSMESG